MEEEWRPIPGYEGWYSVSSAGRVRRDRTGRRTCVGRICKPALMWDGYLRVGLCQGSHASLRMHKVHRLVAAAFLGPCPDGWTVNHRDGNKVHNHPANLEYLSRLANHRHATDTGLMRHGAACPYAKLTDADVREILTSPLTQVQLAAKFGVRQPTTSQIRLRQTWRHITLP